MNQLPHSPRHPLNRQSGLLAFLPFLLLASCAAAPFLIPAGIEFARNLLVTSNKNYGGKYSEDMNRLMVRLSTPYVAMGLPMGTSPAALVPPAMLQQQQQAMMNQMGGQTYGQGMAGQYGMGGYSGYVDQYNPTAGVPGAGYPPGGYGTQQGYGYGGMSGYGGMQGQYGYQGQGGGYYDPNNPYASVPGMNVQAPAYGMNQQYAGQYGGQFGGAYGGQMGGYPPQPGYPAQQGLPPQPGYPAAAPGAVALGMPGGYPPQTMTGYPQQGMPMQQAQGYQQQPMDPYQQQAMQGYQQQPAQQAVAGGYQQPMQGYQQPGMAQGYNQTPNVGVAYQGGVYPRGIPGTAEPVALDVALIRQVTTANGKQVSLMQDGEVLKGGPDGDRFKLVVRTNCECFVYVISVDGSGWAQPVFPVANGTVSNPLKPEVEQAFPDGPYWFTLDQLKGVESFFLVASPARRTDVEESLAQLAGQQRPAALAAAQVEEPAVIPNGFGTMQAGHATQVRDEAQQQVQVTALSYVAAKPGDDVRVTRWFKHQ